MIACQYYYVVVYNIQCKGLWQRLCECKITMINIIENTTSFDMKIR